MDQKPVIQYVGQFYVYGSEVKAPKKKQQSAKVFLPKKPKTGKERRIYVDPVAISSWLWRCWCRWWLVRCS